jgi:type II secretory pathway pseudopilin PulG
VVVVLASILTLTIPTLPQAEAQARVTTVTVYVRTLQTVYVRVLQTVIQTVKFPVTYWNTSTYWNHTTYWNTTTTGQMVSKWITETASVTAPIQIGPLSLDLSDAYGLRFLAFSGAVALGGFIGGTLVSRLGSRRLK